MDAMSERPIALKVSDKDNVATIFADDIHCGTVVQVRDRAGTGPLLTALGDVPYGHKIALCDIAPGEDIVKYGERIGVASRAIVAGDYVHVHNLDSMRGRGDLEATGSEAAARGADERGRDDA